MPPTGPDYTQSDEYYRDLDRQQQKADKKALDSGWLVDQVGLRVILIEEIRHVRYGLMDGIVIRTDDKSTIVIKDLSDESIHRFKPTSSFDWYQSKYFMKSSWWRRHKYLTKAARDHRVQTYQLFDAALAKGIYAPEDIDQFRNSSDWALRWNLGARLGMSVSSSWSELMNRIKEM